MGVGVPDFREGQVKNKAKTESVQFPRTLKEDFPICPQKGKSPFCQYGPKNLSDVKLEQEH